MRSKHRWLWWLGLAVVGVLFWRGLHRAPTSPRVEGDPLDVLADRLWVDHLPRRQTEKFFTFVALRQSSPMPRTLVGAYAETSAWEGCFWGFQWRAQGECRIRMRFPQMGKRAVVSYEVRRSDRHGFDYLAILRGSPYGPERWYSREDWRVGSLEEARVLAESLTD